MEENLQSLLEKINRDGIEKAQRESEKILANAKDEAGRIVQAARAEADRLKAEAEKVSADFADRAAVTIRQAARDTVLNVQAALTQLLTRLLLRDVQATLADEKAIVPLLTEAIRGLTGTVEVSVPPALAPALQAQLAQQKEIRIVLDETLNAGFTVRTENGRIEQTFTDKAIAGELARRLRPDLAKLVSPETTEARV